MEEIQALLNRIEYLEHNNVVTLQQGKIHLLNELKRAISMELSCITDIVEYENDYIKTRVKRRVENILSIIEKAKI